MSTTTTKFVLTGPHAGQTLAINGHPFEDGEYIYTGSAEQSTVLARIFGYYGALPEREARLQELEAKMAEMVKPAESVEQAATATATAAVEQAATAEAVEQAIIAATAEAVEQVTIAVAVEQANTPAAVDARLSLGEAIGQLDPSVDGHWTSNNLPSLDQLAALVGKKVSRDDVEAVADGYTRAKARAARN